MGIFCRTTLRKDQMMDWNFESTDSSNFHGDKSNKTGLRYAGLLKAHETVYFAWNLVNSSLVYAMLPNGCNWTFATQRRSCASRYLNQRNATTVHTSQPTVTFNRYLNSTCYYDYYYLKTRDHRFMLPHTAISGAVVLKLCFFAALDWFRLS